MNCVHHLHIKGITYFFFLLLALSAQSLLSEGFAAGTAVYTSVGFRPIEEIEPGHEVFSCDRAKQVLAQSIVLQRHCHRVDACVHVHLGDQVIEVDDKQRFLDADSHEWCEAKKLASGQRIVTHNQVAKTITSIQRKKLAQTRVLYALSLCHGPRNFCVTKDKIVTHNEPVTFTVVFGIASIALQVGRAGWNGFLAWRGSGNAEKTLKEVMEYYAAQGFSEELNCLTLNEITQHEAMLTLSRPVQDQLGRILNKYGGKARLSACTLDEITEFHVSGVLNAAAATKHYAQMTPDGIAADAHRAGLSGAARGAIGGAVALTINLATGNVDGVGDAVNTIAQPALEGAVKGAALNAGKNIGLTFSNAVAPTATAKILPYIPYVGIVWNCWTIVRDGYALGKDVNAFFKQGKKTHEIKSITPKSGGGSGNNGPPPELPKGPQRNTDFFGNMHEVFKKALIGPTLKAASKATNIICKGAKVFELVEDLPQFGLKKGDCFYLDTLHRDHIEVFKSCRKIIRTVLNMNGTQNLEKLAQALKRPRWI